MIGLLDNRLKTRTLEAWRDWKRCDSNDEVRKRALEKRWENLSSQLFNQAVTKDDYLVVFEISPPGGETEKKADCQLEDLNIGVIETVLDLLYARRDWKKSSCGERKEEALKESIFVELALKKVRESKDKEELLMVFRLVGLDK